MIKLSLSSSFDTTDSPGFCRKGAFAGIVCTRILLLLCLLANPFVAAALELKTAAQDSPPKYFLQDDGNTGGICIDILRAVEGVDPQLRFSGENNILPFKRLQLYLESGQLDVFFGLKKTPSRIEKFTFSRLPLYPLKYVIAVRGEDTVRIDSFEDIRRLGEQGNLLTVSGSAASRFLHDRGGLFVNDSAPTPARMIKLMLAGRGRFAFYHDLGLKNAIDSMEAEQRIRILPLSFSTYHHYAAFSKNMPPGHAMRIDRALQKIRDNGTLAEIHRKYGLVE